jgi:hypothetical protein
MRRSKANGAAFERGPGDGGEVDRLLAHRRTAGLRPRQHQELVDDACHGVEPAIDRDQGLGLGGRLAVAQSDRGLRLQHGERGAQLMRGVGDEAPLQRDIGLDSRESVVQRVDQRLQFGLEVLAGSRLKRAGIAGDELAAQAQQRRQAPVKPNSARSAAIATRSV